MQEIIPQNQKFRAGICPQTARAVASLTGGRPGDTLQLDVMERLVGRKCRAGNPGYPNVQSAIKIVEREQGLVWRWDRSIPGWRCLTAEECVGETRRCITQGVRKVGRGVRVASTINPAELPEGVRKEHALNMAVSGAIRLMGGAGIRRRLENTPLPEEPKKIEVQKVLDLIKE